MCLRKNFEKTFSYSKKELPCLLIKTGENNSDNANNRKDKIIMDRVQRLTNIIRDYMI